MRVGFSVPNYGALAADHGFVRIAERADDLGFDVLWLTDHVVLPRSYVSHYPYTRTGRIPIDAGSDYFEPLATLAYLGSRTRRVRLGTSVLVAPYRNPVVTAKQIATIDALTGGRMVVGVGVGWLAEEFAALGALPFEHRGAVTDETIQIWRTLWRDANPHFSGRFFQIADVGFFPKPIQHPGPPILIGGDAPAALRRVARFGDGWQPFRYTVEELRDKLNHLRTICAEEGRDFTDLIISLRIGIRLIEPGSSLPDEINPWEGVTGTPAEISDLARRFQDLGVHEISFHHRSRPDLTEVLRALETIAGEIMPRLE